MATNKATTEELALMKWDSWTGENGWTHATIDTANLAFQSRELRRLNNTLQSILNAINMLGSDGLHMILRDEAAKRRKGRRLKLARAAAKRRRTIAAKKAAAGGTK